MYFCINWSNCAKRLLLDLLWITDIIHKAASCKQLRVLQVQQKNSFTYLLALKKMHLLYFIIIILKRS